MKKINIRLLISTLLLTYTQIGYFIPGGGAAAKLFACLLFAFVTGQDFKNINNIKIEQSKLNFIFILYINIIFSVILNIFGTTGELEARDLVGYFFLNLIFVVNISYIAADRLASSYFVRILTAVIGIETIIIIGQLSFIIYGIGFTKFAEFNDNWISGSMANPNDSVSFIALLYVVALSYHLVQKKLSNTLILVLLVFPSIVIAMSRSIFIIYVISLFFVFFYFNSGRAKIIAVKILFLLLIPISVLAFSINGIGEDNVFTRNLDRLISFGYISGDSSVYHRSTAYIRLYDNIMDLGFGSLSDLNYSRYFNYDDAWLITVNPHSLIVEYSFLFGYLGLALIVFYFFSLAFFLFGLKNVAPMIKLLFMVFILVVQSVPASLLASIYFLSVPIFFIFWSRYSERYFR